MSNNVSIKEKEPVNKSSVQNESKLRTEEDNDEMDASANDMFLSESIGLDVTIDSDALAQFDYNESVDLVNS